MEKNYYKEDKSGGVKERVCNCRKGAICPMGGQCLHDNMVYHAEVKEFQMLDGVTNEVGINKYIGSCSTTFKKRLGNHTKSFKHARYSNIYLSNNINNYMLVLLGPILSCLGRPAPRSMSRFSNRAEKRMTAAYCSPIVPKICSYFTEPSLGTCCAKT